MFIFLTKLHVSNVLTPCSVLNIASLRELRTLKAKQCFNVSVKWSSLFERHIQPASKVNPESEQGALIAISIIIREEETNMGRDCPKQWLFSLYNSILACSIIYIRNSITILQRIGFVRCFLRNFHSW